MTARPPAESNPWGLAAWERILFGLLSVAAAVGVLWLTAVALFIVGMGTIPECSTDRDGWGILFALSVIAAWVLGFCWLGVVWLISAAVRGSGIGSSRWLLLPAAFIALTVVYYAWAWGQPLAPRPCPPIYD